MRPELRSNSAPSPTISVDDSGIASLGETLHASLITHDHKSQLSSKRKSPQLYTCLQLVCPFFGLRQWVVMGGVSIKHAYGFSCFIGKKREIPPR